MFFSSRLLLCCVFLAAAGLTAPAGADVPKHTMVVQTFEPARNNGTPLVQVRFSNTLIGTFIIDTGEIESVMTEPFARKANFSLVEDENSLAIGLHHVRFVQAPEIKLANLTLVKQTFRVVSQDFLPGFDGRQIDGILGGNLLSQFALRIDYPAHEIDWITPGNLDDKAAAELGFTPQNRIELGQERFKRSLLKLSHYSLRADFQNGNNPVSEDMMIDTGSPVTTVSAQLADELHLRPLAAQSFKILDRPSASYHYSIISQMQIGQAALTNVSVLASDDKDNDIPPILGETVLSNCVVLLDFGPHRLYLKPVLPPAKPETPLDKTQIVWDRLRVAPDLPTIEEMLANGFAPDAQDTLAEQSARLRAPLTDSAKDAERLEKLGVLLYEGQDAAGAKAAFAQAAVQAAAAAKIAPGDSIVARRWAEALMRSGRPDEAIAAATQITIREPASAPGWRFLGNFLTLKAVFVLLGEREQLTDDKALKIKDRLPGSPPNAAESALLLRLLVQAHAALDRAVALAPSDPEAYNARAIFHLVCRASLSVLQAAGTRINLPASEVPSQEAALAEALADWQQCASHSPNDSARLSEAALVDQQSTFFHNRSWLTKNLKGTGCALPETLMTTAAAQSRLTLLTQGQDKAAVVLAWTALGETQSRDTKTAPASEKSWRQALALDPAHSDALALLVAYLYHAGRWQELQDLLVQQCTLCDSVPLRLTRATLLNGGGQPAEAETQVRAALTLASGNAAANLTLAEMLLARSANDPKALAEASACLGKARLGYATLASPAQKATLTTTQAVWLALDHDPVAAEKQLIGLAQEQPNCTQVREALAALVTY